MHAIKGDDIGSLTDAMALEKKGDLKAAILLYEKLLKQSPSNLRIIQRLLILFRKTNNVKKEIHYIDTAIKIHEKKYTSTQIFTKKATTLSNQLNKMLGHTDKKGKITIITADVVKLQLRKARLLKKNARPGK